VFGCTYRLGTHGGADNPGSSGWAVELYSSGETFSRSKQKQKWDVRAGHERLATLIGPRLTVDYTLCSAAFL
jgi:hypothetical protein